MIAAGLDKDAFAVNVYTRRYGSAVQYADHAVQHILEDVLFLFLGWSSCRFRWSDLTRQLALPSTSMGPARIFGS